MPTSSPRHPWTFLPRFRQRAFGWKSRPGVERVRQAVTEILRVARKEPLLGAEGAVQRVAPALENVDSSSGAIGGAVNRAIEQLVPVLAAAPADGRAREQWLERLWAAYEADRVPYIEKLADHWGELCASKEVASQWADALLPATQAALARDTRDNGPRGFFRGTSACLSALFRAERHAEILALLEQEDFWPYRRFAVKALAATGRPDEAIHLAESSRGPWTSDADADALCEEILLAVGRAEEAYDRFALRANGRTTYLATFRAIAAKYPHKDRSEVLTDLARQTPGEEGRWFAAAKDAGLFDVALDLAARDGCDPRTLARAARDFATERPEFAARVGVLALEGFVRFHDEEITPAVIRSILEDTLRAAEACGQSAEVRERVRVLAGQGEGLVRGALARELGRRG